MIHLCRKVFVVAFLISGVVSAEGDPWQPVTDPAKLTQLFSDTTTSTTLAGGSKAKSTYRANGTGELKAWGVTFARHWRVEGEQVCLNISGLWQCFKIDKHKEKTNYYRATQVVTRDQIEFNVTGDAFTQVAPAEPVAPKKKRQQQNSGSAAEPSADEIAKKLANPNTPLATLTLKLQHRTFDGDLPKADDQSGTSALFQPSFPFPLENGDMVFFRPAIPVMFDQPVFDANDGDFSGEAALGDISFDLAYGVTTQSGLAIAGGIIASLPTATEDGVGTEKFSLGPEFLIAKLSESYVVGVYPNHMWDVAGSGDVEVNMTSMQVIGVWLPGGGWNVGSSPVFTYDHENSQATVPVNLSFGKTLIVDGRPWKLGVEINYYTEKSDEFGPDWMIGFSIGPVVENALAHWFK